MVAMEMVGDAAVHQSQLSTRGGGSGPSGKFQKLFSYYLS